jgi:hypothetical protein
MGILVLMSNTYAGGVYIVATTNGREKADWAAAVPREQAVAAVESQLAPGWTAMLTERRLTPGQVEALKMRVNSVRKL